MSSLKLLGLTAFGYSSRLAGVAGWLAGWLAARTLPASQSFYHEARGFAVNR